MSKRRNYKNPDVALRPLHLPKDKPQRCPECGHLVLMPCVYCRDKRAIAIGDVAAPAEPVKTALQSWALRLKTWRSVTDAYESNTTLILNVACLIGKTRRARRRPAYARSLFHRSFA